MLVLTRKPREGVVLVLLDGRQVRLTVLEAGDGEVRLGVDAPRSVEVLREELVRKKGSEVG